MSKKGYVYLITNKRNGTLYLGVTSNLQQRVWKHKNKTLEGFSHKYDLNILVWYEVHDEITQAIKREKAMKKWDRAWKIKRIENMNPKWEDLYDKL